MPPSSVVFVCKKLPKRSILRVLDNQIDEAKRRLTLKLHRRIIRVHRRRPPTEPYPAQRHYRRTGFHITNSRGSGATEKATDVLLCAMQKTLLLLQTLIFFQLVLIKRGRSQLEECTKLKFTYGYVRSSRRRRRSVLVVESSVTFVHDWLTGLKALELIPPIVLVKTLTTGSSAPTGSILQFSLFIGFDIFLDALDRWFLWVAQRAVELCL